MKHEFGVCFIIFPSQLRLALMLYLRGQQTFSAKSQAANTPGLGATPLLLSPELSSASSTKLPFVTCRSRLGKTRYAKQFTSFSLTVLVYAKYCNTWGVKPRASPKIT